MDEPNKRIVSDDLPHPEARVVSASDISGRRWHLLQNSILFLAGYSCLHKIFIPLALGYLGTSRPEYAKVDLWFLPVAVFGFLIRFYPDADFWIRALGGAIGGHTAISIWHVASGATSGWLSFSHILSTVPLFGLIVVYFGWEKNLSRLFFPWALGCAVFAALFFGEMLFSNPSTAPTEKFSSKVLSDAITQREPVACGNSQWVYANDKGKTLTTLESVVVSDCGFSPPVGYLSGEKIQIINKLSRSANVHVLIRSEKGDRRNQNVLVEAGKTLVLHGISIASDEAGMIYSDANLEFGGTMFVHPQSRSAWEFSRQPLRVEVLK